MVIPLQEWSIMKKSHIMNRTPIVTTKFTHQRRSNNTHQRRKMCLHMNRQYPQIPKQRTIKNMFRRMRQATHKNRILHTPRRILRYKRHLYPPLRAPPTRDLMKRLTRNIRIRSTTTWTINMENAVEHTTLDPRNAQGPQENTEYYTLCCMYRNNYVRCITPSWLNMGWIRDWYCTSRRVLKQC